MELVLEGGRDFGRGPPALLGPTSGSHLLRVGGAYNLVGHQGAVFHRLSLHFAPAGDTKPKTSSHRQNVQKVSITVWMLSGGGGTRNENQRVAAV